ncbi:hypothetical protein BTS2_3253 [Bacillus sp. TS-2]|nr:hypothetical protein BTS2_3253 [Bacillus sp. TS-2]
MSTNHWFNKKLNSFRMHMDSDELYPDFLNVLLSFIENQTKKPLVIVCIGTDRSTGDSLGPLIGSKLESAKLKNFDVFGTLKDPVHAVNMKEKMDIITIQYEEPFIIAIDACLGKMKNVGEITISDGPVRPGAAVKKDLPSIGDIHMTGIVNIGGMMEYFVLQNTRLFTVMSMADMMAKLLIEADQWIEQSVLPSYSNTPITTHKQEKRLTSAFHFFKSEKLK